MDDLPTVERYKRALVQLARNMPHKHRDMLIQHYRAPERRVTASKLAAKVGYKNHSAVNLQYGILGEKLASLMGWRRPSDSQASYALASFIAPSHSGHEWIWAMHPNLARAIEELRWVPTSQGPA